jgi:hypothetical protein
MFKLPLSAVLLLPDIGHIPHLEATEHFNRELLTFKSSDRKQNGLKISKSVDGRWSPLLKNQ